MQKQVPAARERRHFRGRRMLAAVLIVVVVIAIVAAVPRLREVLDTLADVDWKWAALSVLANIASLGLRGLSWRVLIGGALGGRHAGTRVALRAYVVGQLVNAVLLARVGEASKVAVYTEHLDDPGGDWAIVTGTVAAHRALDTIPLSVLIVVLAVSIGVPGWTIAALVVSGLALGGVLLVASKADGIERRTGLWRLVAAVRQGLSVLRTPRRAALAAGLQGVGWMVEVAGVWLAFQAFGIDEGVSAAGLVVVATNAATLVPFVPGSVGVFQVTVAGVLEPVGVGYTTGLAFGVALQAVEMLSTLSTGLPSAAREGLSMGALWRSPVVRVPAVGTEATVAAGNTDRD